MNLRPPRPERGALPTAPHPEIKKCIVVGVRGLEPPTSASRTLRASQLRHTPINRGDYISSSAINLVSERTAPGLRAWLTCHGGSNQLLIHELKKPTYGELVESMVKVRGQLCATLVRTYFTTTVPLKLRGLRSSW